MLLMFISNLGIGASGAAVAAPSHSVGVKSIIYATKGVRSGV